MRLSKIPHPHRPHLPHHGNAIAIFVATLCLSISAAFAQPAKRALQHSDFDAWRSIATPILSRDGKWLAYSVQPQDGDGELVIRELASGKERRETVGALPPPPIAPEEENPDAPPVPRAIRVTFTSDSRFLVATTFASKADTDAARKGRKKPDDMPKGGLMLFNLVTNDVQRVANVKSVQVPTKGGAWLAYLKEEIKTTPPTANASAPKPGDDADDDQAAARRAAAPPAATTTNDDPAAPKFGTDLVLRDLMQNTERTFANVLESSFARDGKTLLFAVAAKAETDNGIYAITPQSDAAPVPLLVGKGKYLKTTWDREQTQAAFVSDRDDAAAKAPSFKLYHWPRGTPTAKEVVSAATLNFPAAMTISDKGNLAFSRDGKKLYLPVAPPAKPPRAANSGPTEEQKVVADLWRWNDDTVQPMQRIRAVQEKNRSYRGVLDLATMHYRQLADMGMRNVSMSDDGTRAVGSDDSAYRRLMDYDAAYADLYVVNTSSGEKKLALKKLQSNGNINQNQWSPDGNGLLYYQNKHWHVLNTTDGSTRNLSARFKVALHNEEHDMPSAAASYGTAGWASDSGSVLLYDRFDVWQVFLDSRNPQNLTRGEGRKTKLRFRVQRTEPVDEDDEERGIDTKKPLVLRAESEETRASGFFRVNFAGVSAPERLVWGDSNIRYLGRAQEADVLLTTATRFNVFPELQISDANFSKPEKVTAVGAQKDAFRWGTGELMAFKNAKGVALKAAVYKPDDFDPNKKYPLLVYIYERLSQNVHNFVNPAPSNGVNPGFYVSNGYVLLMPDIAYTIGQPGQSALDAVLPAIDKLVKQGFIDEKSIGIAGHSWGGYQIAWMVTQTNRFRAAEAGAPVGNMTSAYSGIRWGSGLPRQFQYERQQSRIGPSLQAAPALYLANSPVFHVTKVKTPLLILANDADDAVPWYQGIELFLALRRHEKEAYLFNYNGQRHNLRRRADQKDFAKRMHQYFDHFLKGVPAPEWMVKGIAFNDREEEKERFGNISTSVEK